MIELIPIALTTLPSSLWSHTSTTTRLYQLRNYAPTICSPLQQTRSLQRRRARSLVSRHTIRPRSNHRSRQRLTRAVHQQAPGTLAHVRLQSDQDEILTSLQQVPATPHPALLKEYMELIGSLLFLQTGTIPEISCIVSVLA